MMLCIGGCGTCSGSLVLVDINGGGNGIEVLRE